MDGKWEYLGSGQFNNAYVNRDKGLVFKIPKYSDMTDAPGRAARVWNEINPSRPAHTGQLDPHGQGWFCPYIEGRQATDHEVSQYLIETYNRTGRIIIDAVNPDNLIYTADNEVVCIDVGLAIQFQTQTNKQLEGISLARQASEVSLLTWEKHHAKCLPLFDYYASTRNQTVHVLKALLFIQAKRPDIYDASFLLDNENLVKQLSTSYMAMIKPSEADKEASEGIVDAAEAALESQRPSTVPNVQKSIQHEMELYIQREQEHAAMRQESTQAYKAELSAMDDIEEAETIIDALEDYDQFVDVEELGYFIEQEVDTYIAQTHTAHGPSPFAVNASSHEFKLSANKSILMTKAAGGEPENMPEQISKGKP